MTFEKSTDFTITYARGLTLLWALSDTAKTWVRDNLPQAPGERIHASTAIAMDKLDEVVKGIRESGMTI